MGQMLTFHKPRDSAREQLLLACMNAATEMN